MAQVLKGDKQTLHYFELVPLKVGYPKILTISFVFDRVKECPVLAKYLPDSPASHITKEYLFTVVNTVDSTFFARCVQKIEGGNGGAASP